MSIFGGKHKITMATTVKHGLSDRLFKFLEKNLENFNSKFDKLFNLIENTVSKLDESVKQLTENIKELKKV